MRYLIIAFAMIAFANEPKPTVEQLFGVQTVKPKKVLTSKRDKNYGYVRVDESRRYSVTPRFGGYVEVLYADSLYKYVNEGEILAKVYSPEVLSAKEEYLSSLKFNKVRKNGEMLKSSRDKLLLLNVAKKEINLIEKSYKISKTTNIYAPRSGYVFSKSVGNLDSFNAKQKLFEIVNMDKVWVETSIHQKDLDSLAEMKNFSVGSIGIKEVYKAKRGILYPSLKANEATLTLRLHVENKNGLLRDGMYVSVISSAAKREFLTLPSTSVIRKNGAFYVFVAGEYEDEYEPTQVEVKVLNADTYEITSGITQEEEVVNHALFLMDSDAQINGLY